MSNEEFYGKVVRKEARRTADAPPAPMNQSATGPQEPSGPVHICPATGAVMPLGQMDVCPDCGQSMNAADPWPNKGDNVRPRSPDPNQGIIQGVNPTSDVGTYTGPRNPSINTTGPYVNNGTGVNPNSDSGPYQRRGADETENMDRPLGVIPQGYEADVDEETIRPWYDFDEKTAHHEGDEDGEITSPLPWNPRGPHALADHIEQDHERELTNQFPGELTSMHRSMHKQRNDWGHKHAALEDLDLGGADPNGFPDSAYENQYRREAQSGNCPQCGGVIGQNGVCSSCGYGGGGGPQNRPGGQPQTRMPSATPSANPITTMGSVDELLERVEDPIEMAARRVSADGFLCAACRGASLLGGGCESCGNRGIVTLAEVTWAVDSPPATDPYPEPPRPGLSDPLAGNDDGPCAQCGHKASQHAQTSTGLGHGPLPCSVCNCTDYRPGTGGPVGGPVDVIGGGMQGGPMQPMSPTFGLGGGTYGGRVITCPKCGTQGSTFPEVKDEDKYRCPTCSTTFEKKSGVQHTAPGGGVHGPYYIREKGGKFVVVNARGEVKGTHDTKEEAREQQKALYANIPEAREQAEERHDEGPPKAVKEKGKAATIDDRLYEPMVIASLSLDQWGDWTGAPKIASDPFELWKRKAWWWGKDGAVDTAASRSAASNGGPFTACPGCGKQTAEPAILGGGDYCTDCIRKGVPDKMPVTHALDELHRLHSSVVACPLCGGPSKESCSSCGSSRFANYEAIDGFEKAESLSEFVESWAEAMTDAGADEDTLLRVTASVIADAYAWHERAFA